MKLTALQTRVVDVDALTLQMAQVEACSSELEEKVVEIEEKEDYYITYLEAHLKGLSLGEVDKKQIMILKAKRQMS